MNFALIGSMSNEGMPSVLVGVPNYIMSLVSSDFAYIVEAPFRSENFWVLGTVALSFVFGN